MSPSPVISTIPIFALLIVGTVLSAPREEIIAQSSVPGELHETREFEVIRNNKGESLEGLAMNVAKEAIPVANQNETEKPMTLSTTTLRQEKVQANDSESKDMLGTHVTPQDDDDDHELSSEKPLAREASNAKKSKHVRATTIFAPIEFPTDNTDVDIRMATPEWIRSFNQSIDKNNATNLNATNASATNSNATNPRTKKRKESKFMLMEIVTLPWTSSSPSSGETPTTAASRVGTSTERSTTTTMTKERLTLIPGIIHKETERVTTTTDQPISSSSHSPAELKLHEKKIPEPETMPTGVAAVIAAISFAIIVVVTYIGLLVRRRCVEWRYGNRELLVNDFDAADMTNFEL